MIKKAIDRQAEFGKQLLKYREVTGMTQEEYGRFLGVTQGVVFGIEAGKSSVGIKILEKHAQSFGVPYYVMGNPAIPPPTFNELPKKLKDYIEKVKGEREKKKAAPRQNITEVLDDEIPTFLAKPKTALEFATHLKKFDLNTTSQNIETLLTSRKRQKLVRVIPASEWGGEVDKYVLKL